VVERGRYKEHCEARYHGERNIAVLLITQRGSHINVGFFLLSANPRETTTVDELLAQQRFQLIHIGADAWVFISAVLRLSLQINAWFNLALFNQRRLLDRLKLVVRVRHATLQCKGGGNCDQTNRIFHAMSLSGSQLLSAVVQ